MKNFFPKIAVLACWLLTACSSGSIQFAKNEDLFNSYASAIRWGEFERAQEFQNPAKRTRLDLAWLKNIRIASYDVQYKKEDSNSKTTEITAEIRYTLDPELIERKLVHRQMWKFNEEQKKYVLETDLPAFK